MSFLHPWVLWLLPLALLALLPGASRALANTFVTLMPRDRASAGLHVALRLLALLSIACTITGLAGPYRPDFTVERVGTGAEIVLLLDRSRSMDQGFAGGGGAGPAPARRTGPEALDYYAQLASRSARDPKGQVARRLLAEFTAKRRSDRFGMVVFSTVPMPVLGFTQKQEVIQAAIAAGNIGRGLADTDIGQALLQGLSYFEGRAYTGSRVMLLVSDGGDQLDPDTREHIRHLVRRHRVSIYWLYLRSLNSPGLQPGAGHTPAALEAMPESALDRYFKSLGAPYRAYEADNPEALQRAIDDVDRLDNLPIVYQDIVPRRDLSPWALGAALLAVLGLLAANLLEIRRWA